MQKKNILMIGAGAVGAVYGHRLSQHHNITFLVKEKNKHLIENGFYIHNIGKDKKAKNLKHFTQFNILTYDTISTEMGWDQIYLCVPGTALGHLDFSNIKTQDTSVVLLSSGQKDKSLVEQFIPSAHIVSGMIGMLSRQWPQEDSTQALRVSYLLPPLVKMPFSSETHKRAKDIADTFKQCGFNSSVVKDAYQELLFPNIILSCLVLGLEKCNWSFKALIQNKTVRQAIIKNNRAFIKASEQHYKTKAPFALKLITPTLLGLGARIIPKFFPLDIEAFLKFHYTKVGAQTRVQLKEFTDLCDAYGVDYDTSNLVT